MINALGTFVLRKAMQQQRNWQEMGLGVAISVNVSQQQLSDPGFAALVAHLLAETGCAGNRIELEITETLLVEGKRTVHENLDRLRALDMRIAIDDFGTGYSNLARLSDTEIHCIKIDHSLIAALPRNAAIVQTVIAMCKVMRVAIVAEGVETQQTANWVSRHGCDELQGYLYGKPMPAAEMQGVLTAEQGTLAVADKVQE
ncbi:MAG: EAL domain-containing protein [Sphingopyxis terrae]|nr:MAG: EAL domain-containing protein [Sphingopyxis terrae]